MATKRYRDWTFVIYPESAPSNWEDIIDSWHVQVAVSPIHDIDVNPDGECKKPHWHCVITFEGVQSYDAVKELIAPLNGTIPQVCKGKRGMIRYFVHLDNPEKAQYDKGDIKVFGGFDIDPYFEYSITEQKFIIGEMIDWCIDQDTYEYSLLLDYARYNRYDDWFEVLVKYQGGRVMKSYCDSKRNYYGRN